MRSLKEMVSPMVIAAGLATSAGAAVDAGNNTAMHERAKVVSVITESVENAYGVEKHCEAASSGGLNVGVCGYDVEGSPDQPERQNRISAYERELAEKLAEVPALDPASEARAARDLLGFFGGLGLATAGVAKKLMSKE